MTILELPPVKWELQKVTNIDSSEGVLGDGYNLRGTISYSRREDFILTFPGLTDLQYLDFWGLIKSYSGVDSFEWRPFVWSEYKTYVFTEPKAANQGINVWEISVTLKEISPSGGAIDSISLLSLISSSVSPFLTVACSLYSVTVNIRTADESDPASIVINATTTFSSVRAPFKLDPVTSQSNPANNISLLSSNCTGNVLTGGFAVSTGISGGSVLRWGEIINVTPM